MRQLVKHSETHVVKVDAQIDKMQLLVMIDQFVKKKREKKKELKISSIFN
eukprot:CAMPEP_0170505160 /NCGR_PEP_ID=MMETSP0208-20121228/50039_1 /TAXON_ID=197538 /ORGANISM="Strombidium inclinatum, Strain S3" /LENGTH=49 /DNA_ID=CAMNT_0010785839 /DNA_START=132 /DNA_END=281 /DNA_ORIENTATION=+